MRYRRLGVSGPEVSVIAMGCWAIAGGDTWGPQDESKAIAAIGEALDLGVTLFDTAEGYGESEALLGRGLGGRRGEAIVASKVSGSHLRPDLLREACEKSLRALGSEWIDLYQIHWPNRDVPLEDTIGEMLRLQSEGKIRYIGVSNFGPGDLADLARTGAVCISDQVVYNLLTRAVEFETLPRCQETGIGVLAYSPLAQGLLTGKFASAEDVPPGRARTRHFSSERPQVRHGEPGQEQETFAAIAAIRSACEAADIPMGEAALAWCLHQPGVTSVLAGARSPEQIRENVAAADRDLSAALLTQLDAATQALKAAMGPSIDLWQSAERARSR